jgi:hypothetical protein
MELVFGSLLTSISSLAVKAVSPLRSATALQMDAVLWMFCEILS